MHPSTQMEPAGNAGVELHFLHQLEQGKKPLEMDKVNQVLNLFGYELSLLSSKENLSDERSKDVDMFVRHC